MNNLSENNFELYYTEEIDNDLLNLLKTMISTDKPNDENIIDWNSMNDVKATFKYKDYFVKIYHECRHEDRKIKFSNIKRQLFVIDYLAQKEIPIPNMLGYFSVKSDDGWVTNGIIFENLKEYSTFIENTNYEMIKEILTELSSKGIFNEDFHLENIMTNGTNWKIVDFDRISFGYDEHVSYNLMISRCIQIAREKNLSNLQDIEENLNKIRK